MNIKKGLGQKRIPTVAAFILLFLGVWVTSLLVRNQTLLIGRATPAQEPENVTISDITGDTFTVSFTTRGQTTSAISVTEEGKSPYTIFDDRDKTQGTKNSFYSHVITVENLTPGKTYKFKILSEGDIYPTDGTFYSTTLGPALGPNTNPSLEISGKVILPDGKAASDTQVTAAISGAQLVSTLSDEEGNYIINLSKLRSSDLKKYFTMSSNANLTLKFARQDLSSTVESILSETNVIPTVTLSYQYNFTALQNEETATGSSLFKIEEPINKSGNISIASPKANTSFVDNKPLFQGSALPNKSVRITIDSISNTVVSSQNGFWSYRPTSSISQGSHKITIQTVDGFGISKSLSVNFSVFPSGSQIAESATPSATLIPTQTPAPVQPTATPIPTTIPSPTIMGASPTIIPTAIPTAVPTVAFTPTPTTIVTLPTIIPTAAPTTPPVITPVPTGNSTMSILLGAVSVLLISGGFIVLFLL